MAVIPSAPKRDSRPGLTTNATATAGAAVATPFASSKTMLAEMVLGAFVVTVGAIRSKEQVHFATFAWWAFMWWLVALASMFRPMSKIASGFGALITLTVCIRYGPAALGLGGGEKARKTTASDYESLKSNPKTPKLDTGDPRVNAQGQPDPNGQYSLQPGTKPGTSNIVPLIP